MKYLWLWWNKEDLRTELQQLADEGRDTSTIESEFARLLAEEMPEDAQFHHRIPLLSVILTVNGSAHTSGPISLVTLPWTSLNLLRNWPGVTQVFPM